MANSWTQSIQNLTYLALRVTMASLRAQSVRALVSQVIILIPHVNFLLGFASQRIESIIIER